MCLLVPNNLKRGEIGHVLDADDFPTEHDPGGDNCMQRALALRVIKTDNKEPADALLGVMESR